MGDDPRRITRPEDCVGKRIVAAKLGAHLLIGFDDGTFLRVESYDYVWLSDEPGLDEELELADLFRGAPPPAGSGG